MLDIKLVTENLDFIQEAISARGQKIDFSGFIELAAERKKILLLGDELRQKRNSVSDEIGRLKTAGQKTEQLISEMKEVSDRIKEIEATTRGLEETLNNFLLIVPNIPHPSTPKGKDTNENKEVRRLGEPPQFDFKPRHHWDIGESLGILDFERGAKIAGSRFTLYKGLGARLERALINFMLDLHTKEHGYTEVLPPFMVNRASMTATGQLPKFEEDLFRCKDDDYFLIPTAEVPLTNIHQNEVISEEKLPVSYVAYTPCFRREAGSYGKDTKGLIRQHQFNKVELVKFVMPDRSYEELERLLLNAEEVLKRLDIHYRVVLLCTGDLGFASAKTYDIEVWLPGQAAFREISSCSNFEDFQARRGNIRYLAKDGKKRGFLHTLNGSGLAVGRTLVAILENFQQKDGSILIPKALRPYMDGMEQIS
jgi:seryl-tRNA synthetase